MAKPVLRDESGLAETAGPDDGDETCDFEELGELVEIVGAPDDRGRAADQVVTVSRQHAQRRERGRQARAGDLEELDRVVEVTDPIATERRERQPSRRLTRSAVSVETHDLTAVSGIHHARRLVHGESDVVVARVAPRARCAAPCEPAIAASGATVRT